jgi:hypothetical protein
VVLHLSLLECECTSWWTCIAKEPTLFVRRSLVNNKQVKLAQDLTASEYVWKAAGDKGDVVVLVVVDRNGSKLTSSEVTVSWFASE